MLQVTNLARAFKIRFMLKVTHSKNLNRGLQLKLAREFRGFSQKELCNQIDGLSQSNLSKFEQGMATISKDKLIAIMGKLNFPITWLDVTHQKTSGYLCGNFGCLEIH